MDIDLHTITYNERRKLHRLMCVYQAVQATWYFHKSVSYGSLEADADKSGWYFDWDPIVRECFPEILVVMSGDRREERRFPAYAVAPRSGDWFELQSDPKQVEALLQAVEPTDQHIEQMMLMLAELKLMSHSLPAERTGEAMKHLNALTRLIKPLA